MKWQNLKHSDNVEVDCLGERANLNTPEGEALLACQNEVTQLRESMIAKGSTQKEKNRNAAIFDGALSLYLDGKELNTSSGPMSFIQRFTGGGLNLNVAKDFERKLPNLAERYVLRTMIQTELEHPTVPTQQRTNAPKKDESRRR